MTTAMHGTLDYAPKHRQWHFKVAPHVALKLKRVFPRMKQEAADTLIVHDSIDVARDIDWFLTRYHIGLGDGVRARLDSSVAKHQERESLASQMLKGIGESRAFELALPLRSYQAEAAAFALKMRGLLLADDMGLGKTPTAIGVLSDPATRPALVVTLTSLPTQWDREIKRFAPQLRTHIIQKGRPYDLCAFKGSRRGQQPLIRPDFPDVLIINYHKLNGWAETLGAGLIKGVVWDEAQELRREDSEKYRAARFIADHTEYRLALSGTPIYNYGAEMWSVLECVRPNELGEMVEFCREWCDGGRIKEPKAFGFFIRECGLMLRRTRQDVGRQLPKVSRILHNIESDTAKLNDITTAAGELARIILTQNPTARGEKFRAAEELSNLVRQATGIAKAPYVAEFVRMLIDSGEPVVVYAWHRAVYDVLLDRLADLNPVMFTGSESPKQKQAAVDAFKARQSKLILISLRAGSGLDGLQYCCRTVVFAELDYSPGVHSQCETRVDRDGQPDPVMVYYLLASDGSDPIIVDILGLKRAQADGIIDPNADMIEELDTGGSDRIKKLAAAYLAKNPPKTGVAGVHLLSERRAAKQIEESLS